MKIIKRLLWQLSALVIVVFSALFAWANPQEVVINLPLLAAPLAIPVWSLVVANLFIGFLTALLFSQCEMWRLKFKIYRNKKNG